MLSKRFELQDDQIDTCRISGFSRIPLRVLYGSDP